LASSSRTASDVKVLEWTKKPNMNLCFRWAKLLGMWSLKFQVISACNYYNKRCFVSQVISWNVE
jgi:hypothetical protein